jgi:exportin-1
MVANNMAVLKDEQIVKGLGDCLKTNVSSCTSIGAGFISQFGRIYMDMLNIYKVVSGYISEEIVTHGKLSPSIFLNLIEIL